MSQLLETRVSNPLVVSGDVHAFGWSELRAKTGRDDGPVVAPELITTSISSNAVAQSTLDQWPADSPELKHIDGTKRGYTMLTLTHRDASAQLIAVDDQRDPASACRVIKSLSLESGRATYDD
jgi:alkaline phosphatase D